MDHAIRDRGGINEVRRRSIDLPAFAAAFDLGAARACPSFAKLERDLLAMVASPH